MASNTPLLRLMPNPPMGQTYLMWYGRPNVNQGAVDERDSTERAGEAS
jgi:hypothetical protein